MKKLNKSPSFLSQCEISYDKKAKCFKMKKKKRTRLQAPKPPSPQAGGPAPKESGLKRLKKVTKIYEDQKTLEEHFAKV
tara:strand:+ start:179 stop:415 length:237 start_codon:yes stop_codon:yes gene_type:complete